MLKMSKNMSKNIHTSSKSLNDQSSSENEEESDDDSVQGEYMSNKSSNQDEKNKYFESNALTEEEIASEVCHLAGDPNLCKLVRAALKMESFSTMKNKSHADIASLPARQYLDETVVPILMNALSYLTKERPPEPITALAVFLLKFRSEFEEKATPPATSTTEKKSNEKHH